MSRETRHCTEAAAIGAWLMLMAASGLSAQGASSAQPATLPAPSTGQASTSTATPAAGAVGASKVTALPPGYVIGPEDVLTVQFYREKDLNGDYAVRPDGKISIQLVNDIQAAGMTPDEFRVRLGEAASKFFTDPTVTIVVKEIKSRKVFITGQVAKPGEYPLLEPTTVLQLIARAGGLLEFADAKNIVVVRAEKRPDGQSWTAKVNYKDLLQRKNMHTNVELKPSDTVIVP